MGGPRLALIEDDPMLRGPIARDLHAAGYEVVAAASGPEGLALLNDPKIVLAIVDVRLPGRIDGPGVIREARQRNPLLKAIMTSGVSPQDDLSDIGPFLPKPFRIGDLLDAIRRLLDS